MTDDLAALIAEWDADGSLIGLAPAIHARWWLSPRPPNVHAVTVLGGRIECESWCVGEEPHISEYRARDVNPNR